MQTYDRQAMKMDEIATGLLDAEKKGEAKGKAEGKAEGLAEGKAETKREIALKLQQQGSSEDFIVSVTGLSPEELKQVLAAPKS
jgi:predicted transposase/invertase (TIGR01784 family)